MTTAAYADSLPTSQQATEEGEKKAYIEVITKLPQANHMQCKADNSAKSPMSDFIFFYKE